MVMSFDRIIADASRRFGVPENRIRAMIDVESNGNPNAISKRGAGGYMQIMPDTYEELRAKHNLGPDRFDPVNNINAGTAYVRQMYDQFGQDWDMATQAYNAGPGRMQRVQAGTSSLPAETAAYLPKVNSKLGGNNVFQPHIPSLYRPRPGQVVAKPSYIPENEKDLRNLLAFEPEKNHADGLGNLLGVGQTPKNPPGPSIGSKGGRIDDLIDQLLAPPWQPMGRGGYMLAGAQAAIAPLAATRDRKVGFGELLGALGGGLTRGAQGYEAAQRQNLQDEYGNLVTATKLQGYQRDEATRLRQAQGVAQLAAQLRAEGKVQEAQMLEANPALLEKFAEQKFKAPEAYTLAPGAQRRDAAGNIIAQNPPNPPAPRQAQTVQTAEGVFVLNPDGSLGQRVGSPVTAVQKQTPQEREAIIESDKLAEAGVATIGTLRQALALNDKAFSGFMAGAGAWADRNLVPGEHGGTATTEFANLIETGALTQLKAIFGGNPTEGERKILLDLQASINKSPEERKVILDNAIAAAEARVARERQRADALRKGTYYTEGLPQPGGGGDSGSNVPAPPAGYEVY